MRGHGEPTKFGGKDTIAMASRPSYRSNKDQPVELGTIDYINLTPDGKHGDYDRAIAVSLETGKPVFANFVEWSGWAGCKDAGAIFADPVIKRTAEELFVPCAFNTWDRDDHRRNRAMKEWGAGLATSWWGYLRIIDVSVKSDIQGSRGSTQRQQVDHRSLVVSGTRQITGRRQIQEVRNVMVEALEDLGQDIPEYLRQT